MNEAPKEKRSWRRLRRTLIGLTIFATLVAIFYTEEDWRGKRAWENCKRELEAKGAVLDWNAYIPPPVPDDQNFFKAPKMAEWFMKPDSHHSLTNELTERLKNADTVSMITNTAAAEKYLSWSDQFQPDFDLIRTALQRPYARMDGNYKVPFDIPIPNFIAVRIIAQTLAQRAKCNLLLGRPEMALHEVALLADSRRLLEVAPTHKPMTLVAAMINVAVSGLYVDTVAEGLRSNKWQEPQLVALQTQLAAINLAPFVAGAFECEPALSCSFIETKKPSELYNLSIILTGPPQKANLWDKIRSIKGRWWDFTPRGWIYQSMASFLKTSVKIRASLFDEHLNVTPKNADQCMKEFEDEMEHPHLFNILLTIAIPNYSKALQTFAFNQTKANEAQIACALERYHLAHGEYPETLDALAPQFIETIPHDIIGGEPLHYRRTNDGKFLLYSVGWNETDDGGLDSPQTKNGSVDYTNGDWVWKN